MVSAGQVQPKPLELRLTAAPESVRRARHAAREYAENDGAVDVDAVALAVSETVSNAVLHAYREGTKGQVYLQAWPTERGLVVEVSDDGEGMKPNPHSPGLGLGLPIAASVADEFGVQDSPAGGTTVRMRFAPPAQAG